jgi:hypothetical protein
MEGISRTDKIGSKEKNWKGKSDENKFYAKF